MDWKYYWTVSQLRQHLLKSTCVYHLPALPPGPSESRPHFKLENRKSCYITPSSELFSSATGSYWGTRSEPYWVPPVKTGSYYKVGFQAGNTNPTSLMLTIPQLEKLEIEVPFMAQLAVNYPSMSPRQAYSKYLEEHGNTYKGPWAFTVELKP